MKNMTEYVRLVRVTGYQDNNCSYFEKLQLFPFLKNLLLPQLF
jgi:hypothetical protein